MESPSVFLLVWITFFMVMCDSSEAKITRTEARVNTVAEDQTAIKNSNITIAANQAATTHAIEENTKAVKQLIAIIEQRFPDK